MMAFCPEHPKWDQNLKLTPLSETTSIPTPFICGFPPPPGCVVLNERTVNVHQFRLKFFNVVWFSIFFVISYIALIWSMNSIFCNGSFLLRVLFRCLARLPCMACWFAYCAHPPHCWQCLTKLKISILSAIIIILHLGWVVQSWIKITQCWIQIWKLKKHFSFNSFCLQVDDWKF